MAQLNKVASVWLKSVNYSRVTGHKQRGKRKKLSLYSFYPWWKYVMEWLPCPRKRVEGGNNPAVATQCAIPTLRTGILASQQCSAISFLYIHLTIIGDLKVRAGGIFSMSVLTFSWISSRINWDAGLNCWEKETLFHLLKSSTEAFIHLLFIQCSFLASFLFPATQCSIIMKAFKVMTTILRTHHSGKKLTIFLCVGKKRNRNLLEWWRLHTHTGQVLRDLWKLSNWATAGDSHTEL